MAMKLAFHVEVGSLFKMRTGVNDEGKEHEFLDEAAARFSLVFNAKDRKHIISEISVIGIITENDGTSPTRFSTDRRFGRWHLTELENPKTVHVDETEEIVITDEMLADMWPDKSIQQHIKVLCKKTADSECEYAFGFKILDDGRLSPLAQPDHPDAGTW